MRAVIRIKRNINDEPIDEFLLNTKRVHKDTVKSTLKKLSNLNLNETKSSEEPRKLVFKRIDTSEYSTIDRWRESKFGDLSLSDVTMNVDEIKKLPVKDIKFDEKASTSQLNPIESRELLKRNIIKVNDKVVHRRITKILTPLEV